MADIHRLLCTHCTFGTSELETHSADNAAKVLGYSVRKSSLPDSDRGQLRQVFRAVERLLSYSLPRDATAAQKETLSADLAPRRLIFMPNLGGWQVAGQVAYRAHDTAGRPGSYFADLLVSKAPDQRNRDAAPAWSAKEVLQLWSVGHDRKPRPTPDWWVSSEEQLALLEAEHEADNPTSETRWKPPAPERIADIRNSRPALLDDATVFRFLTAQAGDDGTSTDPFVPPRWWSVPVPVRQELMAAVLHATLLGPARGGRETVTLAVEPSVAAVVFYAVCRLLPARISNSLSFSTYEPSPDRPLTGLVATTCLDEAANSADLPTDLTQRAFACDTFRDPAHFGRGQAPSEHSYARHVVGMAVANDWQAIDCFLTTLDLDGVTAADLDRLLEIERLVKGYLTGSSPGIDARRSPLETQFLKRRFRAGIEARLETPEPWPGDLLRVALVWFGDDFEQIWTESEPIRRLLDRYLPRDTKGLAQMLASSGKGARVPMCVRAAAVIAAVKADPQYLPDAFIDYCKDACRSSASSARPEATVLVKTVLSELPDLTALQQARCFELTDLILEGLRETPGLTAALPIAGLLTESLASRKQSLENKADLLAQHHALAKHILPPDGRLQDALSTVFAELLDMQTKDPGRHLVTSGRSRIRQLKDWLKEWLPPGHHFLAALDTWSRLHAGIERLAANAPPWRTWPKVKYPDATDTQPVAELIVWLCPFEADRRIASLERQQRLATGVITSLVTDEKKAETVRAWLAAALENHVRQYGPGRGREHRRTPLWQWAAAGCLAMVVGGTIGLLALGSREAPPSTVHTDTRADTPVSEPKTRAKAEPGKLDHQPTSVAAARTESPATAASPPPKQAPTENDIGLTVIPENGNLRVTWNRDKVAVGGNATIELRWKWPKAADFALVDTNTERLRGDGFAILDTAGKGFGTYEVQLTAQFTDAGSITSTSARHLHDISTPQHDLSQPSITVEDGRPLLVFTPAPAINATLYGATTYACDLHNGEDRDAANTLERVAAEGELRFLIPEKVRPSDLTDNNRHAVTLRVTTRQGTADVVERREIALPEVAKEMRARLREQGYQAGGFPAKPPEAKEDGGLVCKLPALLNEQLFDIWLMTPQSDQFGTLTLRRDSDPKSRWECTFAAPSAAGQGTTEPVPAIKLGHFKVDSARSGWIKKLGFVPSASMHNQDAFVRGFHLLRCCRLCLVYEKQPVVTCQLLSTKEVGPMSIGFNLEYKWNKPPFAEDLSLISTSELDCGLAPFLAEDIKWWRVDLDNDILPNGVAIENEMRLAAAVTDEEKKANTKPRRILRLMFSNRSVPKAPDAMAFIKVNADRCAIEVEPLRWSEPLELGHEQDSRGGKPSSKSPKPKVAKTPWVTTGSVSELLESIKKDCDEAREEVKMQEETTSKMDPLLRDQMISDRNSMLNRAKAHLENARKDLAIATLRNDFVQHLSTHPLSIPKWRIAWETVTQAEVGKVEGGATVVIVKGTHDLQAVQFKCRKAAGSGGQVEK